MNVTCNKCGKRYVIADEKIAGKASVKIRCKQCQNLIQLAPGGSASGISAAPVAAPAAVAMAAAQPPPQAERSPWEDDPTRAMPAPDMTTQWFAMVQGKQEGPFDLRGLMLKVTSGEVSLRTYLWKPGMEGWKRAAEVPDVSSIFAGGSKGANATATGPMQATRAPAPQRDVAVANELPAAEFASTSQIIAAPVSARTPAPVSGAVAAALVATQAPLKDLFNDVHEEAQRKPATAGDPDDEEPTKGDVDPFAALGAGSAEAPPPGEATKFFIAQAGVNRRNPPWKIALFFIGGVVVPATVLYLLSTLHVLPTVTVTTADGQEVQENFFSPSGMTGLKDILTGDKNRKAAEAEEKRKQALIQAAKDKAAKAAAAAAVATTASAGTTTDPKGKTPGKVDPIAAQLPDIFANDPKQIRAPKNLAGDTDAPPPTNGSGLSADAAMKIVADKRKSFEQCIEAALRRTPNLAVGNVTVLLNVGPSGAVKTVGIEPKKWEGADWAQCMMTAGKRIVFPSSDGDTELQVPLKVGVVL